MNSEKLANIRVWIFFVISILLCPISGFLILIFDNLKTIYNMLTPKNITGEIALVTGAAHGLGKCIAIELAKKGCHIAIVDINLEGAEDSAKFIRTNFNVKAKAYQADISSYEEVSALNKKVTQEMGAVSILVNNAGLMLLSSLEQPDHKEVQKMINVNLMAHFWTNQIFLKNMREQRKGHIVAISSLSGMFALSWFHHYTTTKYGVRGMMRALRMELKANRRAHGKIYTTTVFPSFLKTNDGVENIVKDAGIDLLYPTLPGKEVAKSIVYGIQRNQEEIVLPKVFGLFYKCHEVLPAYLQDLILHYLLVARIQNNSKT